MAFDATTSPIHPKLPGGANGLACHAQDGPKRRRSSNVAVFCPRNKAVLLLFAGMLIGCGRSEPSPEPETRKTPVRESRTTELPPPSGPANYGYAALDPDQQKQARVLYERNCAGCHGEKGDGLGLANRWLFPKPRDFRAGNFRLVSTTNGVPTVENLTSVLKRGMPGSAMLPWPQFNDDELKLLVHQVIEFRREGIRERERALAAKFGEEVDPQQLQELVTEQTTPGPPVEVPPLGPSLTPPSSPSGRGVGGEGSIEHGRQLYLKQCASCHGKEGRGDGQEKMVDVKGLPTRPRDLTKGIFKGNPDPQSVFIRIQTGMPGTPMPASKNLTANDVADLVQFVLSLSDEETRRMTVLNREQITARLVPQLPQSSDDPLWTDVPAVSLRTTPLWWRNEFPEPLQVQAVHDGHALAFRLRWPDSSHNPNDARTEAFEDAVAVELFHGKTEPFVGMGMADAAVDVWFWDADREPGSPQVEDIYPNVVVDLYPLTEKVAGSPEYSRPGTTTAAQNPLTLTARAVGNQIARTPLLSPSGGQPSVAAPAGAAGPSAGSALTGGGPGTITFRPPINQAVEAHGSWRDGTWTVMMTRPLAPEPIGAGAPATASPGAGIRLQPGDRVSAAFAIWDGAHRDRDGQKVITIWQDLELE